MNRKWTFYGLLYILFISCQRKTNSDDVKNQGENSITYNYSTAVYTGYSKAHFEDSINSSGIIWDTTYVDSVIVKIDSSKDRIVFTSNTNDPLKIYTQTEYPFNISSNYFRKAFIHNHYQSFYFEGDTLKSYFFKLQQGNSMSSLKEVKFSGSKK